MAATRQPATKALPFGARFWAKLLRKVSPNDARKYRLWALLGWRRAQFQRVEFVEVTNEGGISIRTPPGKGKHLNLPTTVVKCRCEMYATSYKLLQPAGDRFVCAACSTPMPTWETNVAMADIEADGYGGHSFRRTLAICIKLCLLEYNITRTERLAKRINTRLQWFDGTALDEPIPARRHHTARGSLNVPLLYDHRYGDIEFHHAGLLQFGQHRVPLEVFSADLSTGGDGDMFRTGNEANRCTEWRIDVDLNWERQQDT